MEPGSIVMVVSGAELFGVEKVRLALSQAGYKVAAVESQDVQEALPRQKPALLIANLSGRQAADFELCQKLNGLSQAPIIAIGPSGDEAFRVGMLAAAVDDYLVRPVNPRELVARVRNMIRRTQPASAILTGGDADPAPAQEAAREHPVSWRGIFNDLAGRISKRRTH